MIFLFINFSYYNEKEMLMVLKYVQALTSLTFNRDEYQVKQEQIGVVTPYIRQVMRNVIYSENTDYFYYYALISSLSCQVMRKIITVKI